MPLQSGSDPLGKEEGTSGNSQPNSQFDSPQIRLPPSASESQILSNIPENPINTPPSTASEHTIYHYLRAHGWSDSKCAFYITNVKAMQEVLIQHFRAEGWSEDQLRAFNEACDSNSPQNLSTFPDTPPGDNATDFEWQLKLVEEMNRRKRIGEDINFSASRTGAQNDEETRS